MLPAPDIDNPFDEAIGSNDYSASAPTVGDKTIKMQPNNLTASVGTSDGDLLKSVQSADVNSGRKILFYSR